MLKGYTGISFPFRITNQGSVAISTPSKSVSAHIDDSIKQILGTYENERCMELGVYSTIDSVLFEPNDEGLQAILASLIAEDLERVEDRISLSEDDIEFFTDIDSNGVESLYATIHYLMIDYNTYVTSNFKLGEVKQ